MQAVAGGGFQKFVGQGRACSVIAEANGRARGADLVCGLWDTFVFHSMTAIRAGISGGPESSYQRRSEKTYNLKFI
jgi:hypothetical protein